ncbi:MAG: chemotaxis protein CheW [Roseiflexaceae bacterium]
MNDTLLALAAPAGASPASLSDHTVLIVTFQIAHQQYGLPLHVVIEIVRLPALVTLAGAPPTLCGLLNLRGQYVPVLDGRALVHEPPRYDLTSQIVIAGRDRPELGLLVDQVRDVCTVATDQIMPITRTDVAPFLTSVCDRAGESVLLVDLPALLALTPTQAKRKATTATKNRRSTPQS